MAINGTIKVTRQNTSTNWHVLTSEVSGYIKTNFRDNNKRDISSDVTSADGLVRTITYTFVNQAAKNEWVEDTTVQSMLNARDTYNVANNIDLERTETES